MEMNAEVEDSTPNGERETSSDSEPAVETVQEHNSDVFHQDEDEDECRVCRGPAEEGRPLFAPCKCSGSIGLTHQDCLMSWLEVTRGDGRCEVCKTKFRFDPQYADNTPDRLPSHEVLLGLCSRFLARWLPLALRILVAATLWLVVAPFLTSCLYHGWIHRPSSILTRWKRELIFSDTVSGAVIAAIIIISFLSLMSFADFLRVHWQQQERGEVDQRRQRGLVNGLVEDETDQNEVEGGVDDAIVEIVKQHRAKLKEQSRVILNGSDANDTQTVIFDDAFLELESETKRFRSGSSAELIDDEVATNDASDSTIDIPPQQQDEILDNGGANEEEGFGRQARGGLDDENDQNVQPLRNEPPFDPLDPALQDDQADMEINVALDELLGLRGPLGTLIRNLLWLLAFNATYLGTFAFIPKTVGSVVYSRILNTTTCENALKTIPLVHSENENATTVLSTLASLNMASAEKNTTFLLQDVATITLGYFSIAAMIVFMRYGWLLMQRFRQSLNLDEVQAHTNGRAEPHRVLDWQDQRIGARREGIHDLDDQDAVDIGANAAIGVALDAIVAIVKVGILLFLKMFFLPLFLGLCLDASTMPLFSHTLDDRVQYAGRDLFSFVLLHWVAGITFMLIVTVFLLQLREVIHPDLLARLIRPQEPQPDLLGNLMNESVFTHIKRMFLSLAIYAPLLLLHVTLPVQMLLSTGITAPLSFFRLRFWHIAMPQMQIPIELIIFHLSMLALLERYKNSIGGLQHSWMKFMCQFMGLTQHILPLSIQQFELVGRKRVFLSQENAKIEESKIVDPFWYDLSKKPECVEFLMESKMKKERHSTLIEGEMKANGERVVLKTVTHIRLPKQGATLVEEIDDEVTLLNTSIGRYRLRRAMNESDEPVIEVFREVVGGEIARPPDGWDDLGEGGAFAQGRWAWGKERKSTIEWGVAKRTNFRDPKTNRRPLFLMLKVSVLMILSWFAITFTILGFVGIPLGIGRSLYFLFRIPDSYTHDPLAFVIGGGLFFPILSMTWKSAALAHGSHLDRFRNWFSGFRIPTSRKLLVFLESIILWCIVAPMALGLSYEIAVIKTPAWFSGSETLVDARSFALSWLAGVVVLNGWAFFAYFSVFTTGFWANVGNGILEPPIDENGNPILLRNQGNAGNGDQDGGGDGNNAPSSTWQGKDGRVAQFFSTWSSIVFGWEWEKVDKDVLLEDFARPIAKQLASALVGSSLSFQLSLYLVPLLARTEQGRILVPLLGVVELGLFRLVVFRLCMTSHILIQLCSAFDTQLESWFQAAHAAARDDRYLIGEILMNYRPESD